MYNVPGINKPLNFSGDVIADMYLGKISKWNDPRLVKDNPGVSLPDKAILPVYRSDGSGTTFIFTDYLAKVSPDWNSKVGRGASIKWPTGIGQKGNEGVAGMVRQAPNSIGYVELIYAVQNKMEFGAVSNSTGKFAAGIDSWSHRCCRGAAKNMPPDYRISITNAPGPDSYPISSFTWLLIPTHSADPAKTKAPRRLHGLDARSWQGEAAALTYAPLPKKVQDMVRKSIANIK